MTLAVRLLILAVAPVAAVAVAVLAGAPLPVLLAVAVLAGVLAGASAWRAARSLTKPLSAVAAAAEALRQDAEVPREPTGLAECDAAIAAIAEAATHLRAQARADAGQRAGDGERARAGDERLPATRRQQVVGRLAVAVAHDFNNVLGVVSNSLLLLRRLPGVDAHPMPLGALERASGNGARLVRQLQRLARPAAGSGSTVAPRSFLDDFSDLLKTALGSGIRLVVDVEDAGPGAAGAAALPPLRVDAADLELALAEMALDARDAMPAGGTWTLRVRRARPGDAPAAAAPGTTWVTLEAVDDRVHVAGHEGPGLSQVRAFCRAAGGDAQALPGEDGRGLVVRLLLPAREATVAAATRPHEPSIPRAAGRWRLLLVEDNQSLADMTRALLDLEGYDVVHACSAAQALAHVEESGAAAFDVVLSDVRMPGGMDGLEMARRLRDEHPALPIVLVSGCSAAPGDAQEFAMLCKPYAPDDLARLLRQVVDEARAPRAA